MTRYDDTTYGQRIAGIYDGLYDGYESATIDMLAELAGEGPALELGIGTGRIALPLRERGVTVHGIDASKAMIARLQAKPGGEEIEVIEGSFSDFDLEQRYSLIYVVLNTFYGLRTQEEQVCCFQSVSRHLAHDGVFLIEVFVPDLCRFANHQAVRTPRIREDEVQLDVSRHDPVSQRITSQHVFLSEQGTRLYPVELRYAWPSELNLMARIAGLALQDRWSSWTKAPFTGDSGKHISIYTRIESRTQG
jgi:SAM-dependent methyltransferase